jgi:hypothetical protein
MDNAFLGFGSKWLNAWYFITLEELRKTTNILAQDTCNRAYVANAGQKRYLYHELSWVRGKLMPQL